MRGAITGDIIGSAYEGAEKYEGVSLPQNDFELFSEKSRFTDDTVLSIAIADILLNKKQDIAEVLRAYTKNYSDRRYGKGYLKWVDKNFSEEFVGKSFWNGSAMRVSPIARTCKNLEEVLSLSKMTAITSHNHPEWIKWAQAIASTAFLAKEQESKARIKQYIEKMFGYYLPLTHEETKTMYDKSCSCQSSVPAAIASFLQGKDFEDTIRKSVMLWGDTDTIAAMSGGIAEAFYGGISQSLIEKSKKYLLDDKNGDRLLSIVDSFTKKYMLDIC